MYAIRSYYEMLRTLAGQTEASNNFRSELQQVGRQLEILAQTMGRGNRITSYNVCYTKLLRFLLNR